MFGIQVRADLPCPKVSRAKKARARSAALPLAWEMALRQPMLLRALLVPACFAQASRTGSIDVLSPGGGCPTTTLRECSGHGVCDRTTRAHYDFCRCDRGYSGNACDRPDFLYACPSNCSYPQGVCSGVLPWHQCTMHGMRQCTDAGHVGKSALTTIALATMRSCSHARAHHSMHPGGACRCSPGHSGDDCARRTSVNCSVGCSGHGECLDGACACTPGYHGRYCELGCAGYVRLTGQACSGHGVCRPTGSPGRSPDECICHIGFRGEGCEIDADGTLGCERGCSGHGDCLHNRCTCHSGFSGRDCSILLRYSGTAHMMDATTTRLLVALVCLVLTSLCAFCAVRFIESESGKNVYAPQPPVKLKPMAKKVGPGGV